MIFRDLTLSACARRKGREGGGTGTMAQRHIQKDAERGLRHAGKGPGLRIDLSGFEWWTSTFKRKRKASMIVVRGCGACTCVRVRVRVSGLRERVPPPAAWEEGVIRLILWLPRPYQTVWDGMLLVARSSPVIRVESPFPSPPLPPFPRSHTPEYEVLSFFFSTSSSFR
ncbi:hypothetical protein LX36DRAFT_399377 [Colletotrichum falcatum]|nr:hypothetical protein LX36DRAFT_399377 [Colletotrichum falcatum]